jgi:transposase InsO family protein
MTNEATGDILEADSGAGWCTTPTGRAVYTALSFAKKLEEAGIVLSMGRAQVGPGDNAISESFVSTLKCELVHGRRFPTREAARSAVFEYLEARSTTVGGCTPRSAT